MTELSPRSPVRVRRERAVRKGPVGQSPRPPDRLPQQDGDHRRGIARGEAEAFTR